MAGERREGREIGREGRGSMTVAEAGHRGGQRTSETHGREFYREIGQKGGQRVRELIQAGKQNEGEQGARSGNESRRGSTSGRSSSSRFENR